MPKSVRQRRFFAFIWAAVLIAFLWMALGNEPIKRILDAAIGVMIAVILLYAAGITSKEDERKEQHAKNCQYLLARRMTPDDLDRIERGFSAITDPLRPHPPQANQGPDPAPV